jgi:cell division septum initiation protein DivIVA
MLRKENQELREKIKILEDKIANQDTEIIKQQKEIDDLKKENENRNNKDLLKKIIIIIQIINRFIAYNYVMIIRQYVFFLKEKKLINIYSVIYLYLFIII